LDMAGGIPAFRPLGACGHATTDGTILASQARFLNTALAGQLRRSESPRGR
jgi:hypothetical protein